MLTKETVIDQVEVTRDGHVQIRRADLFIEDGVEVAKNYHRHVLSPGDNTDKEDAKVSAVAAAVWTTDVVDAYQKAQELLRSIDA